MTKTIFTLTYSADHQMRFERHLKESRLDAAQEELETLPKSKNILDESHRILVLAQGYKALALARKQQLIQTLEDYAALGSIYQIKVDQALLKEYRSLGHLDQLKYKLVKIYQFESSAKTTS